MFSAFTLVSLQSVVRSNKCNSFQTWSHSLENSLPVTYSVLPALAAVCFSDPLSCQPHSLLLLLYSCIYCQSSNPHFELIICLSFSSLIFFYGLFLLPTFSVWSSLIILPKRNSLSLCQILYPMLLFFL